MQWGMRSAVGRSLIGLSGFLPLPMRRRQRGHEIGIVPRQLVQLLPRLMGGSRVSKSLKFGRLLGKLRNDQRRYVLG